MSEKTHYRKVFKSDHLGVADLEEMLEAGKKLIFTIKEVKQEYGTKVAGRKIDANIAYFVEDIKPMVLNATNSKVIKSFAVNGSPFVEDWTNKLIELYIDPSVKMKGEVVGGVKIMPVQPRVKKPELTPDHKRWSAAKEAVKGGKLDGVKKQFEISKENLILLQS
jgi:hypothetical protein